MIRFHQKKSWNMLIFPAFSVLYRSGTVTLFFSINFSYGCFVKHLWKLFAWRHAETYLVLALAVLFSSNHLFFPTRATEGQPSFFFFFFFFLLSLSLPASQPEPKLTSRLHFQQVPPFITRQGCRRGLGLGDVQQGASNGAECAPHPSFSSPQAAENTGLCYRQQPHSSLTTSTIGLQIYSGEARPAPFSCSLAPSPLSLAPPIQLSFSCLSPSFLGSFPLPSTPLPWSLSSPHWGIIPPTLFH